ncbi:MAG: hypothetical protein M3443_12195, partial [Actinomycetota bacterium]|nr:hypothetical protein [Actinomycetota bacterium]
MGFEVDPDQLRKAGAGLEAIGQDAVDELSGPRDAVAEATPWGADEGGAAIAEAHAELAAMAHQVLKLFTDGMDTV